MTVTLSVLNRCDRATFVSVVGFAFEDSPWIAQQAWQFRPFRNVDELHARMVDVVRTASLDERVTLIASHPDLAGRIAREGRLTAASRGEQTAAGLDRLSIEQATRLEQLNRAYRKRFGFPFVICAREHTKESILEAIETRLNHERGTEIATALEEIAKIARLRLTDAVRDR